MKEEIFWKNSSCRVGDDDRRPCDKLNGCIGKLRKYSAMSMKAHVETYFLTGFLRSGNTTGSLVLDVVRGDDLVEGVSPAMGHLCSTEQKHRLELAPVSS